MDNLRHDFFGHYGRDHTDKLSLRNGDSVRIPCVTSAHHEKDVAGDVGCLASHRVANHCNSPRVRVGLRWTRRQSIELLGIHSLLLPYSFRWKTHHIRMGRKSSDTNCLRHPAVLRRSLLRSPLLFVYSTTTMLPVCPRALRLVRNSSPAKGSLFLQAPCLSENEVIEYKQQCSEAARPSYKLSDWSTNSSPAQLETFANSLPTISNLLLSFFAPLKSSYVSKI